MDSICLGLAIEHYNYTTQWLRSIIVSSYGLAVATPANLPPVEASDIVAYLVLQTSFLTKQFKAYKSLEAYNNIM